MTNANKKFYNLYLKIIIEKYKTKYFEDYENDRLKVLIRANAFLQQILKNEKKKDKYTKKFRLKNSTSNT